MILPPAINFVVVVLVLGHGPPGLHTGRAFLVLPQRSGNFWKREVHQICIDVLVLPSTRILLVLTLVYKILPDYTESH